MTVGTVLAIHRYPVKSMLGEDLTSAPLDTRGIVGDRAYAVIDPAENRVGSAKIPKKWARLYEFSSAYPDATDGALLPPVITFPGGTTVPADALDIDSRLSDALGKPVRFVSQNTDDLKLEAVRPGLDAVELAETMDFPLVNPFFDLASLHIVTTSTLDQFRSLYRGGDYDPRRFRPNLVLDTGDETGFVEQMWIGKTIAVGPEVRLRVFMQTHRCAATTLAHHGLPNDPEILRTANKHNGGNVGVYATVEQPGTVSAGDAVDLPD